MFNTAFLLSINVFIPLFCSIIAWGFGKRMGKAGVQQLLTSLQVFNIFLSIYNFYHLVVTSTIVKITLWDWFVIDPLWVPVQFNFGSLNVSMLTLVSIIGALVYIYSIDYMRNDPFLLKFWSYICLFQFFMFILVISDNLILLIVGWEGIGLCSYLLIGFWFTRNAANKAAMKAMVINSIGDSCLLSAIALLMNTYQTTNFDCLMVLAAANPTISFSMFFGIYEISINTLICSFLLVAVMSKSAQIGLHIWLSDAMEGPTPVSALIHAATMVTAGIFLVMRLSGLFELAPSVLTAMTLLGSSTALIAGTMALAQHDIKKIIAFSTCSQLGYMLFCCGISNYNVAFFHLITHAFFKALLFLTAGAVIHSLGGEQDIRRMGGLAKILPLTYTMMLIGSLALSGFPFLAGFYSKDLILELSMVTPFIEGKVSSIFLFLSTILTAFYSTRLIYYVFLTDSNVPKPLYKHLHEMGYVMAISLFSLAFGSIFVGYILKDLFVGLGSDFFMDSFYILPENTKFLRMAEFELSFAYKVQALILSLFGILLALILYLNESVRIFFLNTFKLNPNFYNIYSFFSNKWYFDKVYLRNFGLYFLELANKIKQSAIYIFFCDYEISIQNYNFIFAKKYTSFFQQGNISLYLIFALFFYFILGAALYLDLDFNTMQVGLYEVDELSIYYENTSIEMELAEIQSRRV